MRYWSTRRRTTSYRLLYVFWVPYVVFKSVILDACKARFASTTVRLRATIYRAWCFNLNRAYRFNLKSLQLRYARGRPSVLRYFVVKTKPIRTVCVHGQVSEPIAKVDVRYLSFSIDISVLAGGHWWVGTDKAKKGLGALKVPPFNLYSDKLDRLTRGLGPSYLRVGGSEADKIHYFKAPPQAPDALVLSQTMWDGLHHYVARNSLSFAFTFKYGVFKRSAQGDWQADEVLALLKYSQQKNYTIDVCELGNELNAYWAFYGLTSQPSAHKLANDYATFSRTIKAFLPYAKVIGPGSAFWPRLGETIRPFSNITPKFLAQSRKLDTALEIIDWHYYPFQSRRAPVRTRRATRSSMLHPRALNEYKKYSQQLKRLRDAYYPNAQLWTGESGSAQCGGEPKLSDRFASCFWWADQLGLGAANGQQVMIRQSLVGGDYGLLDRLTLRPRPDYWLSWMWMQLMGEQVYGVTSQYTHLRVYCHNLQGCLHERCLLLINLSAKPCRIELGDAIGALKVKTQFTLTAKKITSKKVRINGIKARLKKGHLPQLDDFSSPQVTHEIAPYAIAFWVCQ